MERRKKKCNVQYAFYRGDTYICQGDINEISAYTGMKKTSLYKLLTPSYKKDATETMAVMIKIEEDENE